MFAYISMFFSFIIAYLEEDIFKFYGEYYVEYDIGEYTEEYYENFKYLENNIIETDYIYNYEGIEI